MNHRSTRRDSGPITRALTRAIAGFIAAAVIAGLTTLVTATPAQAVARWSGYSIKSGRTADDGWIGGYASGSLRLYQYQPAARRNTGGYRTGLVKRTDLNTRTTISQTARAAWILSKYGAYRNATQQAAVDAATYHLLYGGTMLYYRDRGAQRIRQTGRPAATIRAWTKQMLAESAQHAGAHRVSLSVPDVAVGAYITATATVVDGRGHPMNMIRVRVTYDGNTIEGTTDSTGKVQVQFPATEGGTRTVTARALQLPSHYLVIKRAKYARQASALIAGRRITVAKSVTVNVAGNQTLTLTSTDAVVEENQRTAVRFTVDGQGGTQGVTTELFGPFTGPAAATCTGTPRAKVTQTISAEGTFTTPSMPAQSAAGYYKRKVTLAGNDLNQPVSSCGALFTNRAIPTVTYRRLGDLRRPLGSTISARVGISGLPNANPVPAGIRVFGPFSTSTAAVCDLDRKYLAWALTFRGDDVRDAPTWKPAKRGWYVIQARANATELTAGASSRCGGADALVQIQ